MNTDKSNDKLPPRNLYAKFLQIASIRFNLSIDECRSKYGLFTTNQWYKIMQNNTDKTTVDISNESLQDAAKRDSSDYGYAMKPHIESAFENGAVWQKEKDKAIIKALVETLEILKCDLDNLRMELPDPQAAEVGDMATFAEQAIKNQLK